MVAVMMLFVVGGVVCVVNVAVGCLLVVVVDCVVAVNANWCWLLLSVDLLVGWSLLLSLLLDAVAVCCYCLLFASVCCC